MATQQKNGRQPATAIMLNMAVILTWQDVFVTVKLDTLGPQCIGTGLGLGEPFSEHWDGLHRHGQPKYWYQACVT